jgi:hypothetical protein
MIEIVLQRNLSWVIACSDVRQRELEIPATDGEIKTPTSVALIMAGGVGEVGPRIKSSAGAFLRNTK